MAHFSESFKEGGQTKSCPLCKEPNALDTQCHSLLLSTVTVQNIDIDIQYEEIFYSDITIKAARTADNKLKVRDEYLN